MDLAQAIRGGDREIRWADPAGEAARRPVQVRELRGWFTVPESERARQGHQDCSQCDLQDAGLPVGPVHGHGRRTDPLYQGPLWQLSALDFGFYLQSDRLQLGE